MHAHQEFVDALVRLQPRVIEWLKTSSAEEEAAWREQIKVLETEAVCETDDDEREKKENEIQRLQEFLDHRDNCLTAEYASLIFAYGFARLGAKAVSATLEASVAPFFKSDDRVHQLVYRSFTYRIRQARDGGTCRDALPPEFRNRPSEHEASHHESLMTNYKVDRIRKRVGLLEPAEEIDPFREMLARCNEAGQAINALYSITDPKELERSAALLLRETDDANKKVQVLGAVLDLYPRLPPSFARTVLETAYAVLGALPPVKDMRKRERERREAYDRSSDANWSSEVSRAYDEEFKELADLRDRIRVLEVAARRAADGSDGVLLRSVIRILTQMVEAQRGDDFFQAIPVLAGRCLQSLQRLRLREDLEQLLPKVTEMIHRQPGFSLRRGQDEEKRIRGLRLLMNVAAGWLFLGRSDMAAPLIEETRTYLFMPMQNRHPIFTADLACRYVTTLALSPISAALKGLDELFLRIGPLGDLLTTNSHCSLVRLQIIDAVVRAVVHLAFPEDDVEDYLAVSLN